MDPSADPCMLTDTHSMTDYSDLAEKAPLLMPQESQLGVAAEHPLLRGLQVPTRSYRLTSGFKYPKALATLNITEKDWYHFTNNLAEVARLNSKQWQTVIGYSLGTMAIGSVFFGFLGVIPAVMVAKKSRNHKEAKNIKEMAHELAPRLAWWNENFFRPRGVIIRLDMPYESHDMDEMDVKACTSSYQRREKHEESYIRGKAARKARIVIIPLVPNSAWGSQTPSLDDNYDEHK